MTAGPTAQPAAGSALRVLHEGSRFTVEGSADIRKFRLQTGECVFLGGDPVGLADPARDLPRLGVKDVSGLEGRVIVVVVDERADTCSVATDRFGQVDVYYQEVGGKTVLGTDLRLLPVATTGGPYDQIALAHTLTVYGHRPAKRQTPYAAVHRLGVDEVATIAAGRLRIDARPFEPVPTGAYGEAQLGTYADLLLEAVRSRASADGNVVYLSSGWDSTSLLACLVHLFGAGKVRAIIGRMKYSARSDIINQFEIDRARAVADFFGVSLDVIEFDYWQRGPEIVEEMRPLFRGHHIASLTGLNHGLLAKHAAATSRGDERIFAGEISDGAHNLGFSQFVTIFHPSLDFREYADKMASYLFGPTFLGQLQAGTFADDAVYGVLRSRRGASLFDEPAAVGARPLQLLSSFFLRPDRIPLSSLRNTKVLTDRGREQYLASMESMYLARAGREVTSETLYSWYLHLYNSFHWQGSTVATLALTAQAYGLQAALPFWDSRLQHFLSGMPETWGRGLDLNPTKYPLKWTLKNRIRFPNHLQVGPHSYLYDVDPSFSHAAEILYGSALAPYYRQLLKRGTYRDVLSGEMFDMAYLDGTVKRYLDGVEVRGGGMNDLLSLCLLCASGWYGVA